MATKRHKPEEIVTKLRQVDVLVGLGMARIDSIRQVRIVDNATSSNSADVHAQDRCRAKPSRYHRPTDQKITTKDHPTVSITPPISNLGQSGLFG
jgi:hypothetical protein